MNISLPYILVAILALAVIAFLVFFVKNDRREIRLTQLASIAFAFVLAGVLFSANRVVGYGLMGIGVLLAVADIVNRSKKA